jgi:putative ABC transport system substrate-binding protein
MVSVADPIGVGLIESLARPGGNITGVTNIAAELAGKRLEILKRLVPSASRIAVLVNLNDPNSRPQIENAKAAASTLGLTLDPIVAISDAGDVEKAFQTVIASHADGALRLVDPIETALRSQTARVAAKYGVPTIYPFRGSVEAGGLASYGTSLTDQYRQAATFVYKILHGGKPADLPVEQPVKLELVINAKAAKALGLTVSPDLLVQAADVIE